MKGGSMVTTAFGWLWPGIPSHAHTRHKDARKGNVKAFALYPFSEKLQSIPLLSRIGPWCIY